MRAIVKTTAIAIALAVPALSFAQASNGPLTREQVRAQLIELEHAGYNPAHGNRGTYPAEIQAAEARVAAKNNGMADTSTATTGVGGTSSESTAEAGHMGPTATPTMMPNTNARSMFGHH